MGTLRWCNTTYNITGTVNGYRATWFTNQTTPRADTWWFCGGKRLLATLPKRWSGTCVIAQLVMPFYALLRGTESLSTVQKTDHHRSKRSRTSAAGSFNPSIYIDTIGVPQGVPDEYKARNPISAGFESMFFWWVTIKKVDWINYIYYYDSSTTPER